MMSTESDKPPTKDCYTCNRRRIRCDRTHPQCVKCKHKGFECPGYGRRLRWKCASPSPANTTNSPVALSSQTQEPERQVDGSIQAPPQDDQTMEQFSLSLPVNRQLVDHYANNIAPIMVWLHSEQNGYKKLVVPLADSQKSLRVAILSIAAAHAADKLSVEADFSRSAYENALMLITERVRQMASRGETEFPSQHERAVSGGDVDEAVLAAALILSNHSLFGTDLSLSRIHRKAVRIFIKTIRFSRAVTDKVLFNFLSNQAAIYDVLMCTTIFDKENIEGAMLPVYDEGDVMFGKFLNAVHDITRLSVSTERVGEQPPSPSRITDFEDQLELAHSSTLLAAAPTLASCTDHEKDDFVRTARLYHHAGVLYACKRLRIPHESYCETYHSSKLFRLFTQFRDLRTALHNLAWPVFIAGICSWPNIDRMQLVGKLSRTLYGGTGYGHFNGISDFHDELWDSGHHDWIKLAQKWEERGRQVIPV